MLKSELARLRTIRITVRFRKQRLEQYFPSIVIVIFSFWQMNANALN